MEDDLNSFLKIDYNLKHFENGRRHQFFLKMEYDLNFFKKGRRSKYLSNGRQPEENNVISKNQN